MTATAKDIRVAPISSSDANAVVQRVHYSGTYVRNSQLHLGVFIDGRLEGAMQFGPSLDKRKILGLVAGTVWNGFLELNRMAFGDRLPRNSESRALAVAFRMIRKQYPHIEWIVSFADAAQCGDGTIYRAAGFVLTGIKKNNSIWQAPDGGQTTTRFVATDTRAPKRGRLLVDASVKKGKHILETGGASMRPFVEAGWTPLPGFQMRYIKFLNPDARARLTVPILPFEQIAAMGAGMYRGKARVKQAMAAPTAQRRGSADPHAPSSDEGADGEIAR